MAGIQDHKTPKQSKSIRMRKKSQVTIPKQFTEALDINEGDRLEVRLEEGRLVIVPMVEVPKDQAWFWTKEWQQAEEEASAEVEAGRTKEFDNINEALVWLDSDESIDWASEDE